jgi:hypothetical protein
LQAAEQELGASLFQYSWLLAQSQMHFYLAQDHEALALLKTKGSDVLSEDIFQFLYQLHESKEWKRLTYWLAEAAPLLNTYNRKVLMDLTALWDQAGQHLPEAEQQMWDMLVDLLPSSRPIYEEKLLACGKWRQWVDYLLSAGREPLDYRAGVFNPIAKEAPELLLPLYHQAVERYVLNKNRDSYKAAVKLLKRLAKLYKKMKKDASWEQFFTAFASRNSRLRALQEELRKGKLIS